MIFKTSMFLASAYVWILLNSSISKFLDSKNNLEKSSVFIRLLVSRGQSGSYFKDFALMYILVHWLVLYLFICVCVFFKEPISSSLRVINRGFSEYF